MKNRRTPLPRWLIAIAAIPVLLFVAPLLALAREAPWAELGPRKRAEQSRNRTPCTSFSDSQKLVLIKIFIPGDWPD